MSTVVVLSRKSKIKIFSVKSIGFDARWFTDLINSLLVIEVYI